MAISGVARPQGGRLAVVFYPLDTPCRASMSKAPEAGRSRFGDRIKYAMYNPFRVGRDVLRVTISGRAGEDRPKGLEQRMSWWGPETLSQFWSHSWHISADCRSKFRQELFVTLVIYSEVGVCCRPRGGRPLNTIRGPVCALAIALVTQTLKSKLFHQLLFKLTHFGLQKRETRKVSNASKSAEAKTLHRRRRHARAGNKVMQEQILITWKVVLQFELENSFIQKNSYFLYNPEE
jgi:hypothetical protein